MEKKMMKKEQIELLKKREMEEEARLKEIDDRILKSMAALNGTVEEQIHRKRKEINLANAIINTVEAEIQSLSESYNRINAVFNLGVESHMATQKRIEAAGLNFNYRMPIELHILTVTLNKHSDLMKAYTATIKNYTMNVQQLELEINTLQELENARLNPPEVVEEDNELQELKQRVKKLENKKKTRFFGGNR